MDNFDTNVNRVFATLIAGIVFLSFVYICVTSKSPNTKYAENQQVEMLELKYKMNLIKTEYLNKCLEVFQLKEKLETKNTIMVTATAYVPALKGLNSDTDPDNTACMTKPVSGYTIACSRDLMDALFGKKVYISSDAFPKKYQGVRLVHDLLAEKLPNGEEITNQIDICLPNKREAMRFGIQHNVKVFIIEQ